jgi:hypothetical protein
VAEELRDDTLDLLFELTRTMPERQLADADGLDEKAWQALAAASVVVGLGALGRPDQPILLALAGVAYIAAATSAITCVWPRQYRLTRPADTLWADFWSEKPRDIKHAVVADAASAYSANTHVVAAKRRWLLRALSALLAETVLLGLAALTATI